MRTIRRPAPAMARATLRRAARLLACGALAMTAFSASAYRPWLLASASQVDGERAVVSVDAAGSEDLFKFDAAALPLDDLIVLAPDGTRVPTSGRSAARRHTSFDIALPRPGTYRVLGINDSAIASWKVGDQTRRWRGPVDELARSVPPDAAELQVTRMLGRVETFVTRDAPSPVAPPPPGPGLALQPLGPPTDLSVGDTTRFVLTLDGKPLADADVTVIRGDNRYRYKLGELVLKTGPDGSFGVTWPEAGLWWLGVNHGARGVPAGAGPASATQRESYSATFEVLPQ